MSLVTRDMVVAQARSYLGAPFRFRGRNKAGMDCVGLLYAVGTDLGFKIVDIKDYTRDPEPEKIALVLELYTDPKPLEPLLPGMIVKLRQSIYPMHLGFIGRDPYGRLTVINANMKKRKVVEDPVAEWGGMFISVHDIKGIQ